MFNLPFDLRSQNDFSSPVGPSFSSAPWVEFDLNGVGIKLKVPRHRTRHNDESVTVKQGCNLNNLEFKNYDKNNIKLRSSLLVYRNWDFYGSWLIGKLGHISMSMSVITPNDTPEYLNYFHPRAFESAIANYLTFHYGADFSVDGKRQSWFAPVNWRPQENSRLLNVKFDVKANKDVYSDGLHNYLAIPVSKCHLLLIACEIYRSGVFTDRIPKPTIDEWIDHQPFIELANQVLDSVQITLSPQAKIDQEEALNGLEDKNLVKEFPPLKWTKPEKK